MTKILFVCLGNICRSPMAEFIFKDMINKRGLSERFSVASAATSSDEAGNPIYPGAKSKLAQSGIPVGIHRAVQLRAENYADYDLILGMESSNISGIVRITGGDPDKKIRRLLDYSDNPRDIADPWYTGNFDVTYDDISEGCQALLDCLLSFPSA